MPTDHGEALQKDAAARPSALNVIRAPRKAESAAPEYVLVEYAPESGGTDPCLWGFLCARGVRKNGCRSCLDTCVHVYYPYRCSRCLSLSLAPCRALQVMHCSREHCHVPMPCVCVEHTARSHVEAITSPRMRAARTLMLRLLLCAGPRDAAPGTAGADKTLHGMASHFAPKVTLLGGFVEGETVTARIIFPDLPPQSPPVRMRFVTQWQREDVGTYWLTHGEAMARAKLRQRGHYEAVGEQAFFIPAIDAEPLDAKRFLPIGGEETTADGAVIKRQVVNTLQYECTRRDIGCRLRFTCQPVDLYGHVGRVVQAVTPHILCPFPRIRSMCVRDVQTGLTVSTSRVRAAAAEMYLDAEMLNVPVKTHSLHVVANYVGGDEGATMVKWYRMKRIDPTALGNSDSDFREIFISEQVNPPPHPRPLLPPPRPCVSAARARVPST